MDSIDIEKPRTFTNSEINRLGERLKIAPLSADDLKLLDAYRNTFGTVATSLKNELEGLLGVELTSRPSKSTLSIVAKLNRLSTKLSKIQDIAGLRIVVENRLKQDQVLELIMSQFTDAIIKDRRDSPSFGYRAVHLIIEFNGKKVELQIRTLLQHLWAQLSEVLSETSAPDLKYGVGSDALRSVLNNLSNDLNEFEISETLQLKRISLLSIYSLISTNDTNETEIVSKMKERYIIFIKSVTSKLVKTP